MILKIVEENHKLLKENGMSTSRILDDTRFENVKRLLASFNDEELVNFYSAGMEQLEKLIHIEGIRIKAVHFHKDLDLMLIVLNNRKVLLSPLSVSNILADANESQLHTYELIGDGVGIHWPELDEDISLKELSKTEIRLSVQKSIAG